MYKWQCNVYAFGLNRRGRTRWTKNFRFLFLAYIVTRFMAFIVDWFYGVDSELGIGWEIIRIKDNSKAIELLKNHGFSKEEYLKMDSYQQASIIAEIAREK